MKFATITILATFTASLALAGGEHSGGHDEGKAEMKAMAHGMPGKAEEVSREVKVAMHETDDGDMIFEPNAFEIAQGETIRFIVTNKGELEHEFVIDTLKGNAKHKALMAEMDMEHDDPNSVRLDPGKSGDVIWTFANTGTFEFACLIPGHYESGMHGPIMVSEQMAQATVDYSTGKVKKINKDAGKVTIIHGPLENLDMPSMTMVFRVADDAMLENLSEGQDIEFVADRVKGKLTVTELK